MRYLNSTLLTFLAFFLIGASDSRAFSFDFGDDDYYHHPYAGHAYSPWYAPPPNYYRPPPVYFHPQLPSYDSSSMVRKRQRVMSDHDDAMNRLYEMLYGRYGFDRAEAIKLANKINVTSGSALTGNFHPGAVADYRSRTTPAFWGNEQTFTANAQALQAAAKDLATELSKQPTAEEGAVFLPKRGASFDDDSTQGAPVSARVWEKFNTLSNTCENCHNRFRGPSW